MCLPKPKVPKVPEYKPPPIPDPSPPPNEGAESPALNSESGSQKSEKRLSQSKRKGVGALTIDLTIPSGSSGGSGLNIPR